MGRVSVLQIESYRFKSDYFHIKVKQHNYELNSLGWGRTNVPMVNSHSLYH